MIQSKFIFLTFIFINILCSCFAQNRTDSIIFINQRSKCDVEFSGIKGNFKHEIIFYGDSTFKYTRESMNQDDTTMGTYSFKNGEIILNSYEHFKIYPIKVNEFHSFRLSRKYKLESLGLGVYIIEFDSSYNEIKDTLFFEKIENNEFRGTYHSRKSFHSNAIGFKVYKYKQFCDEYYFHDKNSKKIIFEIIDTSKRNHFYLKNNIVKIVNKDCIIIDSYVPIKFVRYIPEYFKEPLDLNGYERNIKNTVK